MNEVATRFSLKDLIFLNRAHLSSNVNFAIDVYRASENHNSPEFL